MTDSYMICLIYMLEKFYFMNLVEIQLIWYLHFSKQVLNTFIYAESLKSYFSSFGEVTDVVVMRDTVTKKPRYCQLLVLLQPPCVGVLLFIQSTPIGGENIFCSPESNKTGHHRRCPVWIACLFFLIQM